jgi:hypothetical protein
MGGFEHLIIILSSKEYFPLLEEGEKELKKKKTSSDDSKGRAELINNQARCVGYLINIIKIFIHSNLFS